MIDRTTWKSAIELRTREMRSMKRAGRAMMINGTSARAAEDEILGTVSPKMLKLLTYGDGVVGEEGGGEGVEEETSGGNVILIILSFPPYKR